MGSRSRRVLAAALLLLAAVTADASEPTRRALLIGINKYQSEDFGNLRGAVNDIRLLRQVLTTRFGFPEENVQLLTDEDATRDGILRTLREFVAGCGPRDEVYVHYSGHGSQVEDLDGDEEDGLDETIVPHDGRTEGVPDITDDELGEILAGLRTKDALIALDSCHSGTATRGVGIRTRSIPRDDRIELYRRPDVGRRGVTTLEDAGYVLMTGAAPNQSALDGPIAGTFYGFFSYCLGTSLADAPPGASSRDVFSLVEGVLGGLKEQFGGISMPEPQLEGPEGRLEASLFPEEADSAPSSPGEAARFPWVRVRPDRGGALLLDGVAAGAAPGSRWAVFPADETDFLPGDALALALVIGVDGEDAFAEILPDGATVPAGARAIAAAPAPPAERIPVLLDLVPPAMARSIRELVSADLPGVDFVDADSFARFIVDVEEGVCNVYGLGGLNVLDSFPAADARQVAERVIPLFARSSSASILTSLRNPSSRLSLELREALPASSGARGFQAVSSGNPSAYRFRKDGDARTATNSLMLEVRADADCYITIVDVDQTGGITQLFPNDYQNPAFLPDGLIPGNATVRIPDSFEAGNEAGFFWDCGPPTGQETIQVFAVTDPETADFYRATIAEMAGEMEGRGARSLARDPLGALRESLTDRWAARGFEVVSAGEEPPEDVDTGGSEVPEWNTASVTVLVESR